MLRQRFLGFRMRSSLPLVLAAVSSLCLGSTANAVFEGGLGSAGVSLGTAAGAPVLPNSVNNDTALTNFTPTYASGLNGFNLGFPDYTLSVPAGSSFVIDYAARAPITTPYPGPALSC